MPIGSAKDYPWHNLLIIPGSIPLTDLADKMTMENGYHESPNFKEGGSFAGAVSSNTDKPRIILFHKKTLPEIEAETGLDVHLNITPDEVLELFKQNPNEHMTLPDFLIMEKYLFEKFNFHISDWGTKSGQWLNTKSGTRLVHSSWSPVDRKLGVDADALDFRGGVLGVRPSRCFW